MERAHRSSDRLARSQTEHKPRFRLIPGLLAAIFRLIGAFAYKNSIAAKPLTSKSPDYPPAALRPFCSAIDQGAPLLSSSVAMCHGLPIIWGGRCLQPGYQRQDVVEQLPPHRDFRYLEGIVAPVAGDLSADLDQLLEQAGQRPRLRRLGYAPRNFIPRRVSVLTVRNGHEQ